MSQTLIKEFARGVPASRHILVLCVLSFLLAIGVRKQAEGFEDPGVPHSWEQWQSHWGGSGGGIAYEPWPLE